MSVLQESYEQISFNRPILYNALPEALLQPRGN